jgi:hypothetical protein
VSTDAERGKVHKAAPGRDVHHCGVCGGYIRLVPGGQGPTWVHFDSGAVAAPNPPAGLAVLRAKLIGERAGDTDAIVYDLLAAAGLGLDIRDGKWHDPERG